MRIFLTIAVLGLAPAAAPALAQDTTNAVRPGMTEQDVRQRWGDPVAVRRANDWTYLFYENGMEHVHRYNDVVMLQNGQVVDAIIRMPGRIYLGQSSSPPGRVPVFTPPRGHTDGGGATGTVTGVRVTP
jgi:hypothetical protein